MKRFLGVVIFILFVAPLAANADGVIFPPPDYWVQETDQKAVIFYEKNVETMIISVTFRGDAKNFSWIVPTPSRPEVEKSTDELFTALAKLTAPEFDYRVMPMYSGAAEKAATDSGVNIIETKKVEYYDITVLEADDPDALTKWLAENDYQFPADGKYLLDDYINNRWYFTAVKINTESLSEGVAAQLREGRAVPLKFTFNSTNIVYPLKISGLAEYFKYPDYSPTPLTWGEGARTEDNASTISSSGCSVSSDCGGIFCPQVVGQDTVCCDEGQCICGPAGCGEAPTESIPEVYPVPPMPYWQPNVSVLLYVFSDHKKDLPGFNTEYANWIKAKEIKNLAIESDGAPWIKTSAGKYYLTKLSRYMNPSEMTYDLYLRDAEDNDRVAVSETGWQGGLLSVLVFLVTLSIFLVVGFISPLGLIFIVCTLLQFFTKPKVAHVLAWIFQGLAVLITIGIGLLWLLGWYHYGEANWYGVAPYNWSATYMKSVFAAGLVAWILFISAMVGVIIWQILRLRKK